MASKCDLCIVHNADANSWRDYIVQLVEWFVTKRGAQPLRIENVDDASLTKTGPMLPPSAILIVILSPAHLEFLRCHQNVNYKKLAHASNTLVLRCGVAIFDELADQDSAIFSQFFGWTKLNSEDIKNGEPVTKEVDSLLSRRPTHHVTRREVVTRQISSASISRPKSNTSDSPSNCSSKRSSNRSSSGSTTTTPSTPSIHVEAPSGASTGPQFQVIPTTIRCEVRSML